MTARLRPVLLPFLLIVAATTLPYMVAQARPPAGKAFVGAFYYPSDFYNYLSYAQQAEEGSFLLKNKVLLDEHQGALVNLEWWGIGRLAALLGGHLVLAYRLFAVVAALAFLLVADAWLRRLGIPESHRIPALLLVGTGGGLGGFLFTILGWPLARCLDLYAGLFPLLGLLANPHFVAGTTLLLLALLAYDRATDARGALLATLVATVLALVRPYDLLVLVLVRTGVVLLTEPPGQWLRRLLPLAGLVPVVAYLYWLFYVNPSFAFYAQAAYGFPGPKDFAWALAPALLLAVVGLSLPVPEGSERSLRLALVLWFAFGLVVIALRPVRFSLQFLVGLGFPLLATGAMALVRLRPAVALAVVLGFSTSFLAALAYVSRPNPLWLTDRANMEMVVALRIACRPGDVVMSPPEIGLFAYGLTACRALVSHPIAPDYEDRRADLVRFGGGSPEERLRLLDARRIRKLVLPGDAGLVPVAWLGPDAPFERLAVVGGGTLSLYARTEERPPSSLRAEPARIP